MVTQQTDHFPKIYLSSELRGDGGLIWYQSVTRGSESSEIIHHQSILHSTKHKFTSTGSPQRNYHCKNAMGNQQSRQYQLKTTQGHVTHDKVPPSNLSKYAFNVGWNPG